MNASADVAIVGGGIVGLAHAWAAARRGRSVLLFERSAVAQGASIRNFGMIWTIGQPAGALHQMAMSSRELWLEAARGAGIWLNPCGSLHVVYRADELAVLEEFVAQAGREYRCKMLSPGAVCERSPAVRRDGLLAGLWSESELCVDPRQAIRLLPRWLQATYNVSLEYGTTIACIEESQLTATDGRVWRAEQTVVCGGADFETLFPEAFASAGLRRCKLQMLRTLPQPGGWRLGPHLAGGLTLRHYTSFERCPSLPALKRRVAEECPELDTYGIHVMASQNELGEVVLGDSHEYDAQIEPFDKSRIDELMLAELRKFVVLPEWSLGQRWHGIYAKHPTRHVFTAEPRLGVTICTATGGAGMTLSFGLAEEMWLSRT
jgi:D-hydroxyproline dehydrogenase subunit beta